jgi:DNA invertase Pin-like site-specific DNA recombinase
MSKTYAYIRASTDKQDVDNQRLEILEYARRHDIKVDDFIDPIISSRKTTKQRRIDELMERIQPDDTVIASELSRLGRSTIEVIGLVNELLKRKIRVILIKQGLDLKGDHDMQSKIMITLLSLFAELERDMISLRTKEALRAKKQKGVQLGKPKGTIQGSKFDRDRDKITELLRHGVSVRKIASILGYTSHRGLAQYIKGRNLRPAKR